MHNQRHYPRWKQIKSTFVVIAVFLIFTGTVIWMLNIANIVRGPWSSVISVIFTILGILTALFQWHSQPTGEVHGLVSIPSIQELGHQNPTQSETNSPKVNEKRGALVVHARRSLHGATVNLNRGFNTMSLMTHFASNVVEHEENGHTVFMSIFPLLEPGNYTVHASPGQLRARVTILAGQVAAVDWR